MSKDVKDVTGMWGVPQSYKIPSYRPPIWENQTDIDVHPVIDDSTNLGLSNRKEKAATIISDFERRLKQRASTHVGYPCNLNIDYETIHALNAYHINNCGDPFSKSTFSLDARSFEVGVLRWFASLWEINNEDFWGYITSGGTEGNLYGIYVGRETLPDGILYTSSAAHYSVFKAAKICRIKCEKIASLENGEIDYDLLKEALQKNNNFPAILNVNIGTTVKGAVDNLDRILEILTETGYTEDRFYIHCDGALFGIMMPFLGRKEMATLTFKKPIGSISVSGHKFIGCPFPCGVVITRRIYAQRIESDVEYIRSKDATISGSRNGHSAVYLWYTLSIRGYEGLQKDVEMCVRNAWLLKSLLERAHISVFLNELSNTVVFERPRNPAFIKKWQLACEGDIAHVVIMPNVDIDKLEAFALELVESVTFDIKHDIAEITNVVRGKKA